MRSKKFLLTTLFVAAFLIVGTVVTALPALAANQLILATGGTAGTYYPLGGAMAQLFSTKVPNVNATAQSTGASVENVRLVRNREADLAIIQNDVAHYAYNGQGAFSTGAVKNFSVIASLYPEVIQAVVAADSDISSIADLKGKKISVGAAGSGTEVNAKQVLEAFGISYSDFQPQFLSFAESADQFKDGHIDGFFVTARIPNSAISDVSVKNKIRILNIPDNVYAKIRAKYPFLSQVTVPDDTYMNQEGSAKTIAVRAVLIVRSDMDAGLVYNLTKALFENAKAMGAGLDVARQIKLETALSGVTTPLHPGAEKYFKEKGILK